MPQNSALPAPALDGTVEAVSTKQKIDHQVVLLQEICTGRAGLTSSEKLAESQLWEVGRQVDNVFDQF